MMAISASSRYCRLSLGSIGGLLAALACGSGDGETLRDDALWGCQSGDAVACLCPDGSRGRQACLADGGLGTCECDASTEGPGGAPATDPDPGVAAPPPTGEPAGEEPAERRVYRIPLRVHVGRSALSDDALRAVLGEMNHIWLSQAGVCFEIHAVDHDETLDEGFDLWFTAGTIPGASSRTNGIYRGDHDVWTIDDPSLGPSPNPVTYDAARTSAHELGHGLTLSHQNCGMECPCGASRGLDCDDFLMTSGKTGYFLSTLEVDAARGRAARMAFGDSTPASCAPPAI